MLYGQPVTCFYSAVVLHFYAYIDVLESGGGHAVGKLHHLSWLALATMEGAVIAPFFCPADGVAGIPKVLGNSEIGRLFNDAHYLSVFNLVADFGGELKVIAVVVYAPGLGEIQ